MSNKLVGEFHPIQKVLEKLSEIIYRARFPNEIVKFEVDLTNAETSPRTDKRLSTNGEGLFDYDVRHPVWHYLKVLIKGDGTWTLTFVLPGKRTISLDNDELSKGDEILWEFEELMFTNTLQSEVTSPTFLLEKRYF